MKIPKDQYQAALQTVREELPSEARSAWTNCCGLNFLGESDFCSGCKEHAQAQALIKVGTDAEGKYVFALVEYDRETLEVTELDFDS
jgi:hypothetical protein